MNIPNVKGLLGSAKDTLIKNSPKILIGVGVGGLLVVSVLAVKATPRALKLCNDAAKEKRDKDEEPTKLDFVKVAWKCYIPAAVTGALSIGCILESQNISARRTAVLATAYKISETALEEYQGKVVETIGEKKEEAIRDKIAKKHLDETPLVDSEVIGNGPTLCLDPTSGQYIRSDIETIRRVINDLNSDLLTEGELALNDYYYALGLRQTTTGEQLGWKYTGSKDEQLRIRFSAQITEKNEPCLVLEHYTPPRYLHVDY